MQVRVHFLVVIEGYLLLTRRPYPQSVAWCLFCQVADV